MSAPERPIDLERQLAAIAYDMAELVHLQRDLVRLVGDIGELLDERLDKPVPPTQAELWLYKQDPADYGGWEEPWSLRAFGRYYGYPECCVEAFVADCRHHISPSEQRSLHPLRGYVMCAACERDPGRANHLAGESLGRRIAPMVDEDECGEYARRPQ